jgi:hypothetical protein
MSLQTSFGRALTVAAATALSTQHSAAGIIARTPTISGNGWVALGILGFFVGTVYLLIAGALHVERRDARLGRRSSSDGHGWFGGVLYDDDDDNGHHGNGGNGN